MTILKDVFDNELIYKSFPCPHLDTSHRHRVRIIFGDEFEYPCLGYSAEAILKAMTDQIKQGEKYLLIDANSLMWECNSDNYSCAFHPFALRLPDKFQKPDNEQLVERRIGELAFHLSGWQDRKDRKEETEKISGMLRELVRLARENK